MKKCFIFFLLIIMAKLVKVFGAKIQSSNLFLACQMSSSILNRFLVTWFSFVEELRTGEKKELGSAEEMGSNQGGSQAFKADIRAKQSNSTSVLLLWYHLLYYQKWFSCNENPFQPIWKIRAPSLYIMSSQTRLKVSI